MLNIGPMELLVVLVVALVVLGPDRLPQASRQLGRAMAQLRRWTTSLDAEVRTVFDADGAHDAPPPVSPDGPAPAPARRSRPGSGP
jgi:sec-independent protein translocase protein TatA